MSRTAGLPESAPSWQDTGSAGNPASSESQTDSPEIVGKEAFLRLLVAQIKNQDPLNPADGLQFLTQLAQFSELEQMINIRQELEALRREIADGAAPTEDPADTGTPEAA
jgi:flagellar basal-body rod modification protein FlgD